MCDQIELLVQYISIITNFHLFDLGVVVTILGVSWLETLGEEKVN